LRPFSISLLTIFVFALPGIFGVFGDGHFHAARAQEAGVRILQDGVFDLPVLMPTAPAALVLHTHTADIAVAQDADGRWVVNLTGEYLLQNDEKTPVAATIDTKGAPEGSLALALDGAPLLLATGDGGRSTASLTVAPDTRANVTLRYSIPLGDVPLPFLRYPTGRLDEWPGRVSLRVDLRPAQSLPLESWLQVLPDEWAYAPPSTSVEPAAEWLYDGNPPEMVEFRFINPELWQQLQTFSFAAVPEGPPEAFRQLGELYARLATAAASDESTAARFFAQAVGAYNDGLRQGQAAGAGAQELGGLHASLAALYRGRVVGADGSTEPRYAELMAASAGAALGVLPAEDARWPELERWQTEGLRLLLADARRRGDVAAALALIDRLAASPTGATGAEFLEAERRALVVQQALELLQQDDRPAALALAGDAIADPALQPPDTMKGQFTAWRIGADITDAAVAITVEAVPAPDRLEAAYAALDEIVQNWENLPQLRIDDLDLAEVPGADGAAPFYRLSLRLPAGATGVELARALPERADWALLRALLMQLGPKLDPRPSGLRQQVHMSQPIDLRSAGSQWEAAARSLEQQADRFAATAQSTGENSASTLDSSLQARIRAANYRHVAQAWRNLSRDSMVRISLASAGSLSDAARTWLITVDSPPQMLDVEVESISAGRVMVMALGAGVVLLGAAGLLWRLL